MLKGSNEIRMVWLMMIIIIGAGAWFLEFTEMTAICGIVLIVSLMYYMNTLTQNLEKKSQDFEIKNTISSNKIPLYISTTIIGLSAFFDWTYLFIIGVIVWVYFLLKRFDAIDAVIYEIDLKIKKNQNETLDRLIQQNKNIELSQKKIAEKAETNDALDFVSRTQAIASIQPVIKKQSENLERKVISSESNQIDDSSISFVDQLQVWLFKGNPILKAAIVILLIGLVLLLRFATEHWQISLAMKLGLISLISLGVVGIGIKLHEKNRSFSLAIEGLGLAGLCLTVFFAYYNLVIPHLYLASLAFIIVMALTIYLSLKQNAVELAIMAMLIAYLAPFSLPIRQATAVEFIAYYLVINIAITVLSSIRPWKVLNQIAFFVTVFIGGGYAIDRGYIEERSLLTTLVAVHTALFIWLGFRFSQLLARKNLQLFKLKPSLDLALIFGAPVIGYLYLYMMYFDAMYWRAGFSALFAVIFALLYQFAKRNQFIPFIAQSYLSLMQIFLVLIPPILLPEYWNVVGWSLVGLVIFIYALYKNSKVSRYLSMGLLLVAGVSGIESVVTYPDIPNIVFWILCISYFTCVFIANFKTIFQQQFNAVLIAFLSVLMISATTLLLFLIGDELSGQLTMINTLLLCLIIYVVLNEVLLRRDITWGWLLPKWMGLAPIHLFAYVLIYSRMTNGQIEWVSSYERMGVFIAGLLLTSLWLRPLLGVKTEKEWVSMGTFSSLAFASLAIFPSSPYVSVVILPLSFCFWCYCRNYPEWKMFWQTRATLVLMIVWMMCSQLFSTQTFQFYFLPILNPFDLISIAMLVGFMWMLMMQVKGGLDKGLASIMAVLGLLWLSSYILLRALHVYLDTPIDQFEVWFNSTIQLSLTLLWVILAFIAMSIATKKNIKMLWLLGSSILVIVTFKLVLLDLSHIGTLSRVISFLGAGLMMLLIAYIAPMPNEK